MENKTPSPYAQLTARRLIFVTMLTFAFASVASFSGNFTLGLQICAGGGAIGLIVFVLGGLAVAANREDDDASA